MRKIMPLLLTMVCLCPIKNSANAVRIPENPNIENVIVEEKTEKQSELKTPDKKLGEKEKARMKKDLRNFGVDSVFLDSLFARSDFGIYDMKKFKKIKNYGEYREALKIEEKISHGVEFVKENWVILQKLEREFGVSKYYIAATLGIETDYGRNIGEYNAIYALLTMYNRAGTWKGKKKWARQITDFLKMCDELELDPFSVPSSWAGAIGPGQWMPSTWRGSFKDGNGDGKKDVFNLEDVLYSIAEHYAKHRSVDKAIYAYNPSRMYVRATNEIAGGIERNLLFTGEEYVPFKSIFEKF
ncbi:MAG: lytic murein transglycosylase [Candidatus Anstonellales archaeon]